MGLISRVSSRTYRRNIEMSSSTESPPNTESSDTKISERRQKYLKTVQKSPAQESSFLNDMATKLNQEINISTETAKIGMFGVGVSSLFGGVAVGMKSAAQKDEKAYQEAL